MFARRIADQVEYSAIVFPSLVTRAARVQGKTAAWDGVRRHVELARQRDGRHGDRGAIYRLEHGRARRDRRGVAARRRALARWRAALRGRGRSLAAPGARRRRDAAKGDKQVAVELRAGRVRGSRRAARGHRSGVPPAAAGVARALTRSRSRAGARRAVRADTRGILATACRAGSACSSDSALPRCGSPPRPSLASRRPAAPAAGRVVVVPVNLAVRAVAEVEPGLDPVWRALLAYLASQQQPVVALARKDAGVLWNEVMADEKQAGERRRSLRRLSPLRAARRRAGGVRQHRLPDARHALGARERSLGGLGRRAPPDRGPRPVQRGDRHVREGKIWLNRHGAHRRARGGVAARRGILARRRAALRGHGRARAAAGARRAREDATTIELTTVMRRNPFEAPDQLREGIEAAFGRMRT